MPVYGIKSRPLVPFMYPKFKERNQNIQTNISKAHSVGVENLLPQNSLIDAYSEVQLLIKKAIWDFQKPASIELFGHIENDAITP